MKEMGAASADMVGVNAENWPRVADLLTSLSDAIEVTGSP